jgi:DNA-binding CsgD family transcriptional regulator
VNRRAVTQEVVAAALDGRATDALALATDAAAATGDPWMLVVASFAAFIRTDYPRAATLADEALARATDDVTRIGALGARGLAAAGWWPGAATDWTDAAAVGDATGAAAEELASIADDTSLEAHVARYLVAEGALACGRLDLGGSVVDASGPLPEARPLGDLVAIMRARLLAFRGRIDEAERFVRILESREHPRLTALVVEGTASLVRGNAADRVAARRFADRIEASGFAADDYLSRGCRLLAAFGLIAIGGIDRSARLVLAAGDDERLSAFTLIDRGHGFELLVAMAVAHADLDAAEAWAAQAADLRDHPTAGSAVARLDSRVALLAGRTADAVALADVAVARAQAEGRTVEAAEGEIVGSRARFVASEAGIAVARLEAAVAAADRTGHLAVRRAASRELRPSGRRLRPLAGSGWAGLSDRERDVALLIAGGATNALVARTLHLSEHTVRAHVSRVLAAFAAPSRTAVAVALADRLPARGTVAALTARQAAVAALVARGATNVAIAAELGISAKTVEKHLADIRRRAGVTSRAQVGLLAARDGD